MTDSKDSDGSFRAKPGDRPFGRLVALEVRWPGNRLGAKFPIDLNSQYID
jgi:hypothetical protein